MLLDELKDAKEAVSKIEERLFQVLNKGEWVVSIMDHLEPVEFAVWSQPDNGHMNFDEAASLSESEILSVGRYTKEQLQPVMDQIKLLSGGEQ